MNVSKKLDTYIQGDWVPRFCAPVGVGRGIKIDHISTLIGEAKSDGEDAETT